MPARRKDFFIPFLAVCSDIAAIEAAFLISYWLRFHSPLTSVFPVELGFPPLEAYVHGSLFVIPAWVFLFQSRGLYRPRRTVHFSEEFFPIVRVVVVGMLVVMAAAFFYRAFSFSRLVFALLAVSSIVTISVGRLFVMKFEQWWYRKGHDIRDVVIVGSNETAVRIYETITRDPSLGYRVHGFFSVNGRGSFEHIDAKLLGTIDAVPGYVRDHRTDLILIALPSEEHTRLLDLIRECEGLNTGMLMVPDMVELMTSRVRVTEVEGIPFLQVREAALSTWNQIVKRAFDVVVASVILLATSPLLVLIAVVVKLTSPGPVFYLQERVGLDGRTFKVIKFRTMRADAERETGPVWAKKDDPRTTLAGRFLRRFSLDELPQLFNVLRGEMSIVGPRPERPHFVEQFRGQIPKYLDRHRVKTGMTGWAQVNGLRGNAPIEERTKYDVYYVENWSLVFDLKIIFKTLRAVLFGKDAY
ncbi:MAG: undecaprenyl-phosphate glucose phosphotransferase [Ignavibacteriales bacterium]|nr:undecaprenyl-phosphate glucose phosphotransferase [Ignavibacteriales bacterium]